MIRFAIVLSATVAVASPGVHPAAPPVAELFGCNFLEGKGMADLDKALALFKAALPEIDSPALQKMGTNIWTPYGVRRRMTSSGRTST